MMVDEVSVPSRGFGSDDRPVAARLPPPLLTWFPSPLGVLGLTREIHCALFKVSVPSRGFGSDDHLIEAGKLRAVRFPSPLGVLGLTTGHWTCMRHRWRTSFRPLSGFWV
ncbi:Uncharacterised protein [Mycobacterium tuberculosis]|nr:Uncharacterised protein [Mycobacterium tuberculosis]